MMISEISCDTGDWSNDAENSAFFLNRKIENNLTNKCSLVKQMRLSKIVLNLNYSQNCCESLKSRKKSVNLSVNYMYICDT